MTPSDRIRARLSPAQLSRLADLLDEICDGSSGGKLSAEFRARNGSVLDVDFAKSERVGWPKPTGQKELPLNGRGGRA